MSQNTQMNVDITGNSSTLSLNEVLKKLREVAELGLPENTTESNLIDRLMSALMQKEISDKDKLETGNTRRPPSKSVEQPSTVAIAMAFNAEQIKSIVDSKVINPETSKEFTKEDLLKGNEPTKMSQSPEVPEEVEKNPAFQSLKSTVGFLMSYTGSLTKVGFSDRINSLVSKKVISKEYVEANLKPLLDSFKMSFVRDESGNPTVSESPLEAILRALENQPKAMAGAVSYEMSQHGTEVPYGLPTDSSGPDPSPKEAKELADLFLSNIAL